tara:strand:+ start:138 stop:545 length:408 start_codon:yes stop_codon:yes gene_type:complete
MINTGIYAGLIPIANQLEQNFSDMTPLRGSALDPYQDNLMPIAEGINDAMGKQMAKPVELRNLAEQQRPLIPEPDGLIMGKKDTSLTAGMVAPTGYARNQKKGLVYTSRFPIDAPIMPIAGFYDTNRLNVLGNLA